MQRSCYWMKPNHGLSMNLFAEEPEKSTGTGDADPRTAEKYREAVGLYGSTVLSVRAICARCGVSYAGFRSYLYKYRRDLLLSRHGVAVPSVSDAARTRLRGCRGQTASARAKYGDAIAACGDAKYFEYNVSQIAHLFGLNPTGLSNQLRAHCPGLLERRELERRRLGFADNQQRGVRPWCREQYAAAVKLLRTTELTLPEVAERCGVSFTGLRQHVCFYHKDLQQTRSELRERAKTQRRKGHITGSGRRHEPTPGSRERYRDAVRLYRNTAMTIKEIAEKLGLNQFSFTNYLQTWHREDVFARRGAEYREGASLSQTKQYKKPTAAKYAPAIERLRAENRPTSEIAAEFGLHPEVFRQYLKEHEPELYARQGMMRASNGRSVSRRSMEKYAEALRLYETTGEELKSIARRLGLNYNSLGGFIRRNFPELILRRRQNTEQCGGDETERSAVPASLAI